MNETSAPPGPEPQGEPAPPTAAETPANGAPNNASAAPATEPTTAAPTDSTAPQTVPAAPPAEAPENGAPAETPAAAAPPEGTPGPAPHRPKKRRDERKAPIVFRKPTVAAPAGAKPGDEATAAPASAEAAVPTAKPRKERKSSPKVFRRADTSAAAGTPAEGAAAEAAAEPGKKRLDMGQPIGGRVVEIQEEWATLDLGEHGKGIIDIRELKDAEGKLEVLAGAEVEGVVVSLANAQFGVVMTRALRGHGSRGPMLEAKNAGTAVEGLVTGANKGGLEAVVAGVRGFCPSSQVELRHATGLGKFVGKRMPFHVLEVREHEVVLTRKPLLEEEARKAAAEARKKLSLGAELTGKVTSVRDFGAFVDLGGLEGLIHVSALGAGRPRNPKAALKAGDEVTVEVIRIEAPKEGERQERIALALKGLVHDPWDEAAASLTSGKRVKGKVVRLQTFGAFVELLPGVDGLLHVSAMGQKKRIEHPSEVVKEGEEVEVVVESVDREQKRVKLRLYVPGEAPAPRERGFGRGRGEGRGMDREGRGMERGGRGGRSIEVTVDRVEPSGVMVKWEGGRGVVPNNEVGLPKGADLRKTFQPGTTFKAAILEVEPDGRYRLSKSKADREDERQEVRSYLQRERKKMQGFGTLGDLMKFKKGQ